MDDVNDTNKDEQEESTNHDDATVILPSRGKKSAKKTPVESKPEPEPEPEPVVEENPVEPISMSPGSDAEEPIQMDSPPVLTGDVVATGEGGDKKKWIIIAVVVVLLLCCCCLVAAVALSWDGIIDAFESLTFQVGPGLAWLQAPTA